MEVHRAFSKRLGLAADIMNIVCAVNTAYGSGLIFRQYTDLVIGMLGFFSSVLGAYLPRAIYTSYNPTIYHSVWVYCMT